MSGTKHKRKGFKNQSRSLWQSRHPWNWIHRKDRESHSLQDGEWVLSAFRTFQGQTDESNEVKGREFGRATGIGRALQGQLLAFILNPTDKKMQIRLAFTVFNGCAWSEASALIRSILIGKNNIRHRNLPTRNITISYL